MDDAIGKLESKVLEAIELIHTLRRENSQLRQQCEGLQGNIDDLSARNQRLQSDLEEARQVQEQVSGFEEKRRLIEAKVEGLLEKLAAMG